LVELGRIRDDDELISDKMANLVRQETECFHVVSGLYPI